MENFTIKEKTLDYLSEVVDTEFIKSNPELTGSLICGLINTIRIKNKTLSDLERTLQREREERLLIESLISINEEWSKIRDEICSS